MLEGIVFLFGLVIGSFLNVVIDRLPLGENIVWERSRCDFCKKKLRWYELIPVVSYVVLGGRCLRCKKRLSPQYPVVELVSGVGFVFLFLRAQSSVSFVLATMIFCLLLAFFVIDIKHQILPDQIMIALFLGIATMAYFVSPEQRIANFWAGIGAGMFFLLLWLITKGRGIGFGDVKLSFLLGFLLGYPGIIIGLYIAFLTGAIAGVILIMSRRAKMKSRIAFGPFLIIGAAAASLWGEKIWEVWQSLLI